MDNSVPTSWWKMMLCGAALAFFNIFSYLQLDKGTVWDPVQQLYGTYGPARVMTTMAAIAVLFMIGALVEKAKERDEEIEPYERPAERETSPQAGRYRWVDVD